jgi:hypothetical protein
LLFKIKKRSTIINCYLYNKQNILANVTLFRSKLVPSKKIINSTISNAIERLNAMINLINKIFTRINHLEIYWISVN